MTKKTEFVVGEDRTTRTRYESSGVREFGRTSSREGGPEAVDGEQECREAQTEEPWTSVLFGTGRISERNREIGVGHVGAPESYVA